MGDEVIDSAEVIDDVQAPENISPNMSQLVDDTLGGIEEEQEEEASSKEDVVGELDNDDDKAELNVPDDLDEEDKKEVAIEEEFPDPKGLNEKDAGAFKAMRETIDTLRKEIKKGGASSEREQELQEKLGVYEQKMQVNNFAASEKFQTEYQKPIQEAQKALLDLAKDYEIDPKVIAGALKVSRKERLEQLRDAVDDQAAISELLPAMNAFQEAQQNARQALIDAAKTAKERMAASAEEQKRAQTKMLDDGLKTLRDSGHFLLRESKKDPNWLKTIKATALKNLPVDATEDDVRIRLKGAVSDHLLALYRKEKAARVAAEARLGKTKKATPKVGNKGADHVGKRLGKDQPTTANSFDSLADATLAGIGS